MLGTAPDKEIARKLNRDTSTVKARRRRLGIPANNPDYRSWQPAEDEQLGCGTVAEIARRLGRSEASVRQRQSRLKIPAWRPGD